MQDSESYSLVYSYPRKLNIMAISNNFHIDSYTICIGPYAYNTTASGCVFFQNFCLLPGTSNTCLICQYLGCTCTGIENNGFCTSVSKNCLTCSATDYSVCLNCIGLLLTVQDGKCVCDAGSNYIYSGTTPNCNTICGDTLLVGSELCDDGNTIDGDGCSASCSTESGYKCPYISGLSRCSCSTTITISGATWDNNYHNIAITFSKNIYIIDSSPYQLVDVSILGTDASMTMSTTKILNITVGADSTFATSITLLNGKHLGYVLAGGRFCNLNNYTFSINTLGAIVPTALATASTLSTLCDNLVLSGSGSTSNTFKSQVLTYSW